MPSIRQQLDAKIASKNLVVGALVQHPVLLLVLCGLCSQCYYHIENPKITWGIQYPTLSGPLRLLNPLISGPLRFFNAHFQVLSDFKGHFFSACKKSYIHLPPQVLEALCEASNTFDEAVAKVHRNPQLASLRPAFGIKSLLICGLGFSCVQFL